MKHTGEADASIIIPKADQEDFMSCYRGRQSSFHHAAYMRMGKVLLALHVCQQLDISLEGREIFDYGFGAGTFFRYCPRSSKLFGVEIDQHNVEAVQAMCDQNKQSADLQTIKIESWSEHPLLDRKYDLILCSHVLEHIPKPVEFLERVRECLKPGGMFLALVPINERKPDPHHVQPVFEAKARTWARAGGMWLRAWIEDDPWMYWTQPVFAHDDGPLHKLAQLISMALGLPATLMGPKAWFSLGNAFAAVTGALPTQAAIALTAEPPPTPIMPDPVVARRRPARQFQDQNFLPVSKE